MILHKLREILPDDVTIQPDRSQSTSHVVSSLRAMDQEISTLQKCLCKLLQNNSLTSVPEHSAERGAWSDVIHNPETKEARLELIRKDFERKRGCGTSVQDERLVQGKELAEMWQCVFLDQIKTDLRIRKIVS